MGWLVNTTPRPLYLRERPGTHCIGGWVGPMAGLDGCEKSRLTRIRPQDRPERSKSLYRLCYRGTREMGAKVTSEENNACSTIFLQNEALCSFGTLVHFHQIVRCHAGDKAAIA